MANKQNQIIDFADTAGGHFRLSGIYVWNGLRQFVMALWCIVQWIYVRIIKRYPLQVILIVLLTSVVISHVYIGRARAERDNVCKQLYYAQQQIDSLKMRIR